MTTHPLVPAIRAALAEHANPMAAVAQQRYMKSEMPFRGVTSPQVRSVLRDAITTAGFPGTRPEWEGVVRQLFDDAGYREERYAAIAVARHRRAREWHDPSALGLHEHLIVTGAWWDHVDAVATGCVAPVLRSHRAETTAVLLRWAVADSMWLRRVAVIGQLPHGAETDTDLLSHVIRANWEGTAYGREFFVRKAIGWALRQYARTDPQWVLGFVTDHEGQLSGLSRREALKHLG